MTSAGRPSAQLSSARAPLALAAAAFGCGIWLAGHIHRPASLWLLALAAFLLCALTAVRVHAVRAGYLAVLAALACAGAVSTLWLPAPKLNTPSSEFLYARQVTVIGHVIDDGALLAGRQPRERFDLESELIETGGESFSLPVEMRATISLPQQTEPGGAPANQLFPPLAYGDRVRFMATLRLPRNFRNPGAFDYQGYLQGLGITTLASIRVDQIEVLPGSSGSRIGFWRSKMRRSILDHLHHRGLWKPDQAALFAAMVVGDDSLLLRNVREEFQQTGVYHLLVVSGMNVGLLALVVFWMARRMHVPRWAASVITIALSFLYAFIAGMGVPVMRAALMLSLYLVARLFYRDRAALNATGFAALVVLALAPHAWFEPAFQLTFLALLAISGISLPLLERTSERYRHALRHFDSTNYDLTLEPRMAQLRLDLRLIATRLAHFLGRLPAKLVVTGVPRAALLLYELIVISSITQAVLVLPMRMYFHRAAIIGLPANLLVLPLAGIMMNSAVMAIAASYIYVPAAKVLALIAGGALHWTLLSLGALERWRVSQWRIPDPAPMVCFLAAVGVLGALAAVRRRPVAAYAGIACLFVSAAIAGIYRPSALAPSAKLEVTAIDVGQGDSILVISPEGRSMLIDGGGQPGRGQGEFDYGEDVVSPYLWSRGIDHLEVVALTHAHADHISGLPRVIENFHPQELWLGINPENAALRHLEQVAADNHVQVNHYRQGETFDWGGAKIAVLSPPGQWEPSSQPSNNDSLTMMISYGRTSALLAADVEEEMEQFIAADLPHVDLIKIAHHGSSTSTTPALLESARPEFAVISVGAHNSFGHPGIDVLERLQQAHVKTYRTDSMGVVTFLLDGNKVEARPRAPL